MDELKGSVQQATLCYKGLGGLHAGTGLHVGSNWLHGLYFAERRAQENIAAALCAAEIQTGRNKLYSLRF
jgi:hypothetical protein